jgi:hypothetical protein
VYASPIERTAQTAAAVAERHDVEVHALPGALEADYGEWTGGKLADLAKTDLWKTVQRAPSRARFPGGESMTEMQAFYDAITPRAEEAISYCDKFSLDDMPEDVLNLMGLLYSMIMVSFPVECWKQPRVPDSGAASLDWLLTRKTAAGK